MSSRIRTLLLDANGTHWVAVCLDTLCPAPLLARTKSSAWIQRHPTLRKFIGDRYSDASYMSDWREAFAASSRLAVDVCNTTDLLAYRSWRPAIQEYDLVVILHAAAGDRMAILEHTASWFQGRRGKLAMFVGNEYDLMAEKIAFARKAGVDFICTQLPIEAARPLYEGCDSKVVAMPHALNPAAYYPRPDRARTTDVGFVGDLYERLIGDHERTDIVNYFAGQGAALGLACDIRRTRMPRQEWAAFLAGCKAVIGAESGTYFLQRDGSAIRNARRALKDDPSLSFEQVFERCFAHVTDAIDGKAVSSRHFEPIGTKTCQLLVEGRYNGVLNADEHYIAVRRDLSNIGDAIRRMKDPDYRSRIVEAAYAHVLAAHTYGHRVAHLLDVVFGGLQEGDRAVA